MSEPVVSYDYVLVGGGLQSGLLALAIRHYQPNATVAMIERDTDIGGNHTWSFHLSDVEGEARDWLEPLIAHRWCGYGVSLPGFKRHVAIPYATVPSDHFADVVRSLFRRERRAETARSRADTRLAVSAVGGSVWVDPGNESVSRPDRCDVSSAVPWLLATGKDVAWVTGREVVTTCGERFVGRCVIDCRGRAAKRTGYSGSGYQKFYGFEVELEQDWPSEVPLVMDAATDQSDGFRFFYTLPFTSRRVLVEDTCFSDSPSLDRDDCLAKVSDYLASRGLRDFEIAREESGVLPMPYSGEGTPGGGGQLSGGYAGGWFHAATGYSFPLSVAFAQAIASTGVEDARGSVDRLARGHRFQARFGRFLNRLLFRLVAREHRHRVFRRFYRVLDDAAVARFFAHRFYRRDAFRIVVGIPPTVLGLRPLRFFRSFLRKGHS